MRKICKNSAVRAAEVMEYSASQSRKGLKVVVIANLLEVDYPYYTEYYDDSSISCDYWFKDSTWNYTIIDHVANKTWSGTRPNLFDCRRVAAHLITCYEVAEINSDLFSINSRIL